MDHVADGDGDADADASADDAAKSGGHGAVLFKSRVRRKRVLKDVPGQSCSYANESSSRTSPGPILC